MLIGIMSDSHDNFQGTIDALRLFRSKGAKMVLHAGDMVGSGNCYAFQGCGMDVKLVYGNNDGDRVVLARDFARVGGEYLGDFGVVEPMASRSPSFTAPMMPWWRPWRLAASTMCSSVATITARRYPTENHRESPSL